MKSIVFTLLLLPAIAAAQDAQTDTLVYNSKRLVKLEGGSNFRDLGGYPTQNGHHVKWGRIYRSADVGKLTDADLKTIEDRNVTVVCDLRGPDEYKQSPDRLPAGVTRIELPAGSETTPTVVDYTKMNGDSLMRVFYGKIDHFKAKYKPMFDQLLALESDDALMFHCTAGKDRTGVGAALILSALGVDEDLIMKDYAATDVYWKPGREKIVAQMKQAGMSEEMLKPMMVANPAYLEKTFVAIDAEYGSMDKFLAEVIELTPEKLSKLQAMYVE